MQNALARADLRDGLKMWPVWATFGWHDIRQRYKRSVIGPFWITLSLALTVGGMGLLFGNLFATPMREFMPYLAIGMLYWSFISTVLIESCKTFIDSESMIRQIKMPYSLHVFRMVWRNFIIMGHNAVVVVAVLALFGVMPHWQVVFYPLIVLWFFALTATVSLILAVTCVRLRDMAQLVTSMLQIIFFVTPILWQRKTLTSFQWIIDINPLYHIMEVLREPLLGRPIPMGSLVFMAVFTVVTMLGAYVLFVAKRRMIAFWV